MTTTATKTVKGVLGEKLGMTQVWDADNRLVPVTVIKAGPCVVTQVRKADNDGYDAVQIAFGAIETLRTLRPRESLELVHRLDRDTSGLLLIARKRSALTELQALMREDGGRA